MSQYAGDHGTLERKEDDSDVAIGVNYGGTPFSSWSKFICNPEMGIIRIRGLRRPLPPYEGEDLEHAWTSWPAPIFPKGKPLWSHMVG